MRLTPILLILAIFLCSLAFVATISGAFRSQGKPVAVLKESNGSVYRLLKGEFLWDRTREGATFGLGDTISTGDEVEARLHFHAGGELILAPGTTIVLRGTEEQLQLDFVSGSAVAQIEKGAKNPFAFREGQPVRPVYVDRLSDTVKSAPRPSLKPWLGYDPLPGKSVRTQSKPVLPTADGLPPVPSLIAPANNAVADFTVTPEVPVSWKVSDENQKSRPAAEKYEVVFVPSAEKSQTIRFQTDSPKMTLKPIPMGEYSWSVRSISADGKFGPSSSFRWLRVAAIPTPKPKARKPAQTLPKPRFKPLSNPEPMRTPEPPKIPKKPELLAPKIRYDSTH